MEEEVESNRRVEQEERIRAGSYVKKKIILDKGEVGR